MLTHRHRGLLRVLRGSLFLLSLLTFGWMTVELPRAATQGASQSNTVTTTTSQSSQSSTTDSNLVDQAASKQTNTVDKTNLEKALNSAKALTGHLSDYATISQTLLKTAISNGEILDKSTKFSQTDIDQQTKVINTTIDKMVKRNYDANRYDSVPVGYNNQNQLDTEGAPIQAHGGGVIQTTDPSDGQPIYYWVGEDKSHNNAFFNGINLYSSKDLKNWTYVNTILKPDANNSALFDVIMERPKILYNAKNKQFVVWAHWERQGNYSSSQVAVATSSQAGGEYHFLGHWRPGAGTDSKYRNWGVKLLDSDSKTDTQTTAFYDDGTKLNDYQNVTKDTDNWGTPSRDFTLFQDGSDAYIISTESGTTMRIYKLNADYTDVDKTAMKSYELFTNARREAPAVVKAGDYYVIATSQQSGWSPNQGRYSYTKDITDPNGWKVTTTQNSAGEDINTPFGLLGDNSTYHSQPTNILKVNQNGQTNYIYMGDSWLPSTIGESGYIWLPLKISGLEGNSPQVSMDYTPDWSIDTLSGKLDVPNYPLLSKNKPATSNQQAKGENGVENAVDGDASNTYFQPQQVPYTYTIDLQKSQPLSRVDLSFRLTNGSETYNQYTIETSNDNQNWVKQVDETDNNTLVGFLSHKLTGNARYVRLSVNKTIKEKDHQEADWAAGLVEMSVYGPKISSPIDNNTGTDTNSSTSSSTSSSATTPSSTSQSGATSTAQKPATSQIGKAVYATQKIYMYQNSTFKKSERVASFAKKPRLNRPMFVVTGTAKSSNGVARYKVRNVETNKTGYITANANFVSNVYYASVPASKTVTVIAAKGVNAYKTVGLTGKAKHYKQGTVLKVTGIEKHNLTTRFKLSNGRYITANKKLIIGGKAAQATKVKTKKAIKVYSDANLTHAKKTIKKGKTISVKGYAYSRATSTKSFGTKRYQVSGGYITANSKYVSVVKTTR